MQVESLAQVFTLVDQGEVAVGTEQRYPLGDGVGHPRGDVVVAGVDGVGRHHPIGGVLAAGDRHQPGGDHRDGVFAGQCRGVVVLTGQQRPQTGIHAFDVVMGELGDQHLVDAFEDVVDVGAGGGRVREVEVPVGVGGADDPVRLPRDHEQHRVDGAQDDRRLADDAVAGHHDVHALGGTDLEVTALFAERLHLVGPHAGRVDHTVPAHLGGLAGVGVTHPHPEHPVGFFEEPDHLRRRADDRTVVGGRAGDGEAVPGVVDDGVVIADSADQGAAFERGRHPQRPRSGDMLLSRNGFGATHPVVQEDSGADVGTFPHPAGEREQEWQWLDQMWCKRAQRQFTFP